MKSYPLEVWEESTFITNSINAICKKSRTLVQLLPFPKLKYSSKHKTESPIKHSKIYSIKNTCKNVRSTIFFRVEKKQKGTRKNIT